MIDRLKVAGDLENEATDTEWSGNYATADSKREEARQQRRWSERGQRWEPKF